MKSVIECHVSCQLCGLKDLKVYVDERREGQDMKDWMDNVFLPKVAAGHAAINPDCRPETLTQVKIPVSERGVGFKP